MKKKAAVLFCILVAAVLIFVIRYVNSPLNSVPVEAETHEESISAKGFVVRDEIVYYARNTGTIYNHVLEGARVSKDAIVSTVYSGAISSDTIKELSVVDKKIAHETNEMKKSSLYTSDSTSVEAQIAAKSNAVFDAADEKNISQIARYKEDINKLRAGEDLSEDNRLNDLQQQKQAIENRIGSNKDEIFTEISGIFSTYLDGLETVLKPDRIKEYTAEYIEGLDSNRDAYGNISGNVSTGDPICKVINNHLWYVLVPLESDKTADCKVGSKVTVRFKNIADSETTGTIYSISEPDENNKVLLMIKFTQYLEGAFAYRDADVDIIFNRYTGYKVPIQAIRTEDGKHSVLATAGNKQYKCECEILYSDTEDNSVIITSTDTAQNKISKMDTIIIGER